MNLFEFNDYRDYLRAWLKTQPKGGRGIAGQIATELRVSTVLVSQFLGGTRALQPDHAFGLAKFLGLTAGETEYFLLLVQYENAGTGVYKKYLEKQIRVLQTEASEIKSHVAHDIQLSDETRAKFYSHWQYSAIRLLTDIPGFQQPREIALALGVDVARVREILQFLVEAQLCKYENGKFELAIRSTHLESDSPWVYSRQLQWRQKAIQSMDRKSGQTVYYTGPMVLSKKDIEWVRERILKLIREVTDRARSSPSESLACLNIDWFGVLDSKSGD